MNDNCDIIVESGGILRKKKQTTKKLPLKKRTITKEKKIPLKPTKKESIKRKKKTDTKEKNIIKTYSQPIVTDNVKRSFNPTFDIGKKKDTRETLDFFNKKLEKFLDEETKENGKYVRLITKDIFNDSYKKALIETNMNNYPIDKIPLVDTLFDEYENKFLRKNKDEVSKLTNDEFYSRLDYWIDKLTEEYYSVRLGEYVFDIAYSKAVDDLVSKKYEVSLIPKKETIKGKIISDYNSINSLKISSEINRIK